jgi:aryl-alcohol dehydrogenase-like predicted oxidoreductase
VIEHTTSRPNRTKLRSVCIRSRLSWLALQRRVGDLDELLEQGETRTGFLLRFTNAHPVMNTNIVGTRNVEHLKQNIAAASRPLPADTYAEAKRRLDGVVSDSP